MFVMKKLEAVAEKVKEGETKSDRLVILRQQLTTINLPSQFQLPLNPHMKVLLELYFFYCILFIVTMPNVGMNKLIKSIIDIGLVYKRRSDICLFIYFIKIV